MSRPSTRYRFVPSRPSALERRDTPSALAATPPDLRGLRATFTGSATLSATGSGDRQLHFSGSGKDARNRSVSLNCGSLSSSGTGGAILRTRAGMYRLSLSGPPADLSGTDGITNRDVAIRRQAGAKVIATGTLQIHRMATPSGEQFTATLMD